MQPSLLRVLVCWKKCSPYPLLSFSFFFGAPKIQYTSVADILLTHPEVRNVWKSKVTFCTQLHKSNVLCTSLSKFFVSLGRKERTANGHIFPGPNVSILSPINPFLVLRGRELRNPSRKKAGSGEGNYRGGRGGNPSSLMAKSGLCRWALLGWASGGRIPPFSPFNSPKWRYYYCLRVTVRKWKPGGRFPELEKLKNGLPSLFFPTRPGPEIKLQIEAIQKGTYTRLKTTTVASISPTAKNLGKSNGWTRLRRKTFDQVKRPQFYKENPSKDKIRFFATLALPFFLRVKMQ